MHIEIEWKTGDGEGGALRCRGNIRGYGDEAACDRPAPEHTQLKKTQPGDAFSGL